ncbi:MAG: zinc-ribbon domain-containing protein [Xanthobacteraceae bacterium]|nr:zinc-ribbon domain-containing protein [Xanthobacteraceae bacterium]
MNIVCPNCSTSYAIDPATLGPSGRTVRCARCKETWVAYPEAVAAHADAGPRDEMPPNWAEPADAEPHDTPVVDSPSIASDMPRSALDGVTTIDHAPVRDDAPPPPAARKRRNLRLTLPMACLVMAALSMALVVWRAEIVRLLPQTARFYRLIGLDVNLRGLAFKDVRVTTETADDKPVLVIEGSIVTTGRGAVELPRLRFVVRDAQGGEIYGWNAVMEKPVLKPGEKAWFRSRLASPPPEGTSLDVRFFNKSDLLKGSA